ncbi:MAG: SDR family oxidoreductase [Polyangia bacterium]
MADGILVTGASGNVGSAVVHALQQRGARVRAAGTSPERLTASGSGPAVKLDFFDPATFAPAVSGCSALFLMRPPAIAAVRRTLLPFLAVARAEGVRHVVFLSVQGAGSNPLLPHHTVEQQLCAGPGTWTILRPGFFAQNLQDSYARDLIEDSRLYVPAGAGRVAFIDVRDIAEVAAQALVDPGPHQGQAYTLTGPASLSFAEVAELLSERLGRRIRYEPASVLGYLAHLRRRGLAAAQIAVMLALHLGLRFGQAESVDPTLERLLGRPGRPLREYVRDQAASWR